MIKKISEDVLEEVRTFVGANVQSVRSDNMTGACAIASYTLNNTFRRLGYKSDFIIGIFKSKYETCHSFVILDDQIIDITAKQFGPNYPNIYITNMDDKQYIVQFKGSRAYKDLDQWCKEQNPFSYKRKLVKIAEKISRKWSINA